MRKIVRWRFMIAVVVLLLAAPFALAQNGEKADLPVLGASFVGMLGSPLGQGPFLAASALIPGRTEKASPPKLPTVEQLRDALNCNVMFRESVQLTLPQSVKFLEDQAKDQGKVISILFDIKAIAAANEGGGEVETCQVKLVKRDYPVVLRDALKEIVNQYQATGDEGRLTFAIFKGVILVGTPKSLLASVLNQPVSVEAEAVPLRKLLKQLADQTGVNLVLDPRIKKEPKITVEVHEVSLNTAIRLLAEMADLTAIRLQDDVFFITTKERAGRLRKEQSDLIAPGLRDPGKG